MDVTRSGRAVRKRADDAQSHVALRRLADQWSQAPDAVAFPPDEHGDDQDR